ncbi:MAG: TolC family protein [Chitinispirillaceae bacterium]
MKHLKLILLSGFLFCNLADPLSEEDIVFRTLSQNTDLVVERLQIEKSALDLKDAHSPKYPTLNFSLSGNRTDSATLTSGSATVKQHIPGGGQITGSTQQGHSKPLNASSLYNRSFTASIEQPLLKGAWGADPVQYSIRVSSINENLLSLQNKQTILSQLSLARRHYWDLYEKKALLDISKKRTGQAKKILEAQKARYRIGEATVLDTLSAALEWSSAEQQLLGAQFQYESARSTLAAFLREDADSITITDSMNMEIPDLPQPQEFTKLAREYDPQMEIFNRMRELLSLHLKQEKNDLLPSLDVQASYSRSALDPKFFSSIAPHANKSIGLILSYDFPQTSTRSNIKRRELDLQIQKENEKQHKIDLETRLNELKRRWKLDKLQVEYARASSQLAQKQYEATMKGYELGTESRLSLIKAQNDLASAKSSYAQSLVQMKKLQIILEEITGTTFNRFGVQLK